MEDPYEKERVEKLYQVNKKISTSFLRTFERDLKTPSQNSMSMGGAREIELFF